MNSLLASLLVVLLSAARLHGAVNPPEDGPVVHELHEPKPLPTATANDVRAVAIDVAGRVYAATRAGVYELNPGAASGWRPVPQLTGPTFDVAVDRRGALWVAAWNGLYRLQGERLEAMAPAAVPFRAVACWGDDVVAGGPTGFLKLQGDRAEPFDPGCTRYLNEIVAGPDGALWFATGMGAYRFQAGRGEYFTPDFDRQSANIQGLAFDASGRLWTAALGGVTCFERNRVRHRFGPRDGLPSADVRCVAVASEGGLWFGTADGVARWDGGGWSVRRDRRWLLNNEVRQIVFGPDDSAWVATAGGVSVLRRTNITLAVKAELFHRVLETRHVRPPGIVEKCRLRVPGDVTTWEPMDDDNDGGYTALALAMESYRYAATRDPAALAAARRAFAALEFLQRVTGTPGFVARTVVPADWQQMHDPNTETPDPEWAEEQSRDPRHKRVPVRWRLSADQRWLWKGDTSSDEITAHMFGYFVFHEHAANAADRVRVRDQVCRIVDHLVEHGYTLVDDDGWPTRWGVWAPERLNGDPDWAMERGINSVELLSFLKLAEHVSGQAQYAAAYQRLVEAHHYDRNALEAPNLNPAWRTYIDTELLAFAYPTLLQLERDPRLRRVYRRSFDRWHDSIRADGNPFYESLYAIHASPRRANLAGARTFLREVPLDLIRWTADNSAREDVPLGRFPALEARQTSRLLPPSQIGYSRTDQNPWLAVQGDGGRSESDGVFFLLSYWMGRCYGLIAAPAPPASGLAPGR
jgi:hypothetical protein